MITKCELDLFFGTCNGTMTLQAICSGRSQQISGVEGTHTLIVEITWPSQLLLTVAGKNQELDTVLGPAGEIAADKHVHLRGMRLDNIPIQQDLLHKICQYTYQKQTIQGCYWGFDGQIVINFQETDLLRWLLTNRNVFVF